MSIVKQFFHLNIAALIIGIMLACFYIIILFVKVPVRGGISSAVGRYVLTPQSNYNAIMEVNDHIRLGAVETTVPGDIQTVALNNQREYSQTPTAPSVGRIILSGERKYRVMWTIEKIEWIVNTLPQTSYATFALYNAGTNPQEQCRMYMYFTDRNKTSPVCIIDLKDTTEQVEYEIILIGLSTNSAEKIKITNASCEVIEFDQ